MWHRATAFVTICPDTQVRLLAKDADAGRGFESVSRSDAGKPAYLGLVFFFSTLRIPTSTFPRLRDAHRIPQVCGFSLGTSLFLCWMVTFSLFS